MMQLLFVCYLLLEDIKGLSRVWLLGDNFLAESYRKYFKKSNFEFYMKSEYEVIPFCSSKYSDKNVNTLSRLVNSFIHALNTKHYLPAYMVVLLDDDLIQYMGYSKFKVASLYGPWIEYLSELFTESFLNRRNDLPRKARPDDITQVYWVEPVGHANFDYIDQQLRDKFSKCLEVNAKAFDSMRVLKLRDWDKNDDNLVHNNKITKLGLSVYWRSLDASFEFNNKKRNEFLIRSRFRALKPKSEDRRLDQIKSSGHEDSPEDMHRFFQKRRSGVQNDRFHWSKNQSSMGGRFILPRPSNRS